MSFTSQLNAESIRTLDVSHMGEHIRSMANHMRDALKICNTALSTAQLPQKAQVQNIILAGMGGSAIGGDLVRSYLSSTLTVPFYISRGYRLPAFAVSPGTVVIVSSYSGTTEESLSTLSEAESKGLPVCVITSGDALAARAKERNYPVIQLPKGFQPRAALGYSFTSVLALCGAMGLTSNVDTEVSRAADQVEKLSEHYGTEHLNNDNPAYALAQKLLHTVPVIYSQSDILDAVNLRFRGQLQENAKHLAYGGVLPEMNHNEINGWEHPTELIQHFSSILLRSKEDEHPQVSKRFEVLGEILRSRGVTVVECNAEGKSTLERMFSLISLADWTSYYLALFTGVDPTPIPAIEEFKRQLAKG